MKKIAVLKNCLAAVPRPVKALIMALAGTLLLVSIALAAVVVLFEYDWYATIVPGEQAGELYLDEACTIPAAPFYWDNLPRGTYHYLELYVKNSGVEPIDAYIYVPTDVSAYIIWTITPASIPLNAGEVGHFTVEAYVPPTATLGDVQGKYRGEAPVP